MHTARELAQEIHADERTLRRAVHQGTVRCERPSPRRLEISEEERRYLRSHWDLLSKLRDALRTEPRVRLAVLYGSRARGDDGPDSDADILVSLDDDAPLAAAYLAVRLQKVVGCQVGIARLDRVERDAPLLLLQAIDEGRVLADRNDRWERVCADRPRVSRRARQTRRRQSERTAKALAELMGEER